MRGIELDRLSPELRETRLRTLVDELRWERDALRKQLRERTDRVEKLVIKLDIMRRDRNDLQARLDHATRELSRRQT